MKLIVSVYVAAIILAIIAAIIFFIRATNGQGIIYAVLGTIFSAAAGVTILGFILFIKKRL